MTDQLLKQLQNSFDPLAPGWNDETEEEREEITDGEDKGAVEIKLKGFSLLDEMTLEEVRVYHSIVDLAYEIANNCPNKTEKFLALGLLERVSENIKHAFKGTN